MLYVIMQLPDFGLNVVGIFASELSWWISAEQSDDKLWDLYMHFSCAVYILRTDSVYFEN